MQKNLNDWEMVDARLDALFVLNNEGIKQSQMNRIIDALRSCPVYGCTDEELEAVLGIRRSSVTARRNEIREKFPELIYVAGKRKGSAGIFVDVWKLSELA
jgi:hypothetical protein